jgi:carbonic anhydrase
MKQYLELLKQNKEWAAERLGVDPDYFSRLSKQQSPKFLWIGCSDSRVPANEITKTDPGEIFVHRNIANLVVHTDLNMLSVLYYAVEYLKIDHIIVCGHYGCGGVQAAMGNGDYGLINHWLRNIKDVYHDHYADVSALPGEKSKMNRLVELSVQQQVFNLSKISIIQKNWQERNYPYLHGWVYGLENGIIKEICNMDPQLHVNEIYDFEFNK